MEEKLEHMQHKPGKDKRTRNETWKVPRPKSQGGTQELNVDLKWVTNIASLFQTTYKSI